MKISLCLLILFISVWTTKQETAFSIFNFWVKKNKHEWMQKYKDPFKQRLEQRFIRR